MKQLQGPVHLTTDIYCEKTLDGWLLRYVFFQILKTKQTTWESVEPNDSLENWRKEIDDRLPNKILTLMDDIW